MTDPTIVADLVGEYSHHIRDRGHVYSVPNPRDTDNGDWGWLVNHYVCLDGHIVKVLGVESFCIAGLYRKGRPIGLLIKERLPVTVSP